MSGNFGAWVEERERLRNGDPEVAQQNSSVWQSAMDSLSSVQDGFVQQMADIQGVLPSDLTARQLRTRLKNSVLLFLASIGFFLLAVFIGLPVLVLRPHKFTFCMSMGTILMLASGVALSGPSAFCQDILRNPSKGATPAFVFMCTVLTIYVTIAWRSYIAVVCVLTLQIIAIVGFLISFIPGGERGLRLLLRSSISLFSSSLRWSFYAVQKGINYLIS